LKPIEKSFLLKSPRFDDFDLPRPTTAPSSADATAQNRSTIGGITSLRTGLEPDKSPDIFSTNKSSDIFSTAKPSTDSNKSNDWLGLKDESSEEDESAPPPRPAPKIEPVLTTVAKKTPILPVQQPTPTVVVEPPKKSVLDAFLDDERLVLTTKTPITPVVPTTTNSATDFWLDDRTNTQKRPATAGTTRTPSFTDTQPIKNSTNTDFGIEQFHVRLSSSSVSLFSRYYLQRHN